MDDEQLVAQIARLTHIKVMTRLGYEGDQDIPEYVATRLINAIEWASPHYDMTKAIASHVIEECKLPVGTAVLMRKHFDLRY